MSSGLRSPVSKRETGRQEGHQRTRMQDIFNGLCNCDTLVGHFCGALLLDTSLQDTLVRHSPRTLGGGTLA